MNNANGSPTESLNNNESEIANTHRSWQRKKEIRPQEILAAALKLFVEQGYSATKVAEVARQAGVQPGTIYVYFENKEALFKAVIHASMSPVLSYSNDFLNNYKGTPERLLYELTHQWWNLMESEACAGIPKLITAEANNFPQLTQFYIDQVLTHAKHIVERVLQYGIDRDAFFVENIDVTSRMIMMSLHEMTVYEHSFSHFDKMKIDVPHYLDTLAAFLYKGLSCRN